MKKKQVSILLGSVSDIDIIKGAIDILKDFSVSYELKVLSAHRSPDLLIEYLKTVQVSVIIAAAGLAAHLPGVVAAYSLCPVIGVPIPSGALNGIDSLFSISQMPSGMPVGTMTIGKAGAKNAAIYAIQILALYDGNLRQQLVNFRKSMEQDIIKINSNLDI